MKIFSKLFHKRQQQPFFQPSDTLPNTLNVILDTSKDLSKEQRKKIIEIVRYGIISENEKSNIAVEIMTTIHCYTPITITTVKDGIKVTL